MSNKDNVIDFYKVLREHKNLEDLNNKFEYMVEILAGAIELGYDIGICLEKEALEEVTDDIEAYKDMAVFSTSEKFAEKIIDYEKNIIILE